MSKSIRGLLKKNKQFTVNGSIWIECNGERFFGPGPLELLGLINDTGSINQAAKQMEMSYKKAWEIINSLNTESREPFVVTQAGGNRGGGSIITDEAKEVILWYTELRKRFSALLKKETENLNA